MRKILFFLTVIIFCFAWVYANGVILPYYENIHIVPVQVFPSNPVRMLEHYVKIDINEDIAKFSIDEVFYNDSDATVEVIYLFPIPDQTFITDFKLKVNGVVYEGVMLEKDEAKRIYEDYVRQQKDPALLEYIDKNLIRIRIYPFAPHETRTVQVEYYQEITKEGGYYKVVYPLKIDSLLNGSIGKVKIEGIVRSNRTVYNIYSPTYAIAYTPQPGQAVSFVYAEENLYPREDLVLFIGYGERQYEAYFVNDAEEPGNGSFMFDILPSEQASKPLPKNVILVLDKSGSMYGEKFNQAMNAAKFVLERLNPEDSFGVVLFNDMISIYRKNLLKQIYSAQEKVGAINWINSMDAEGNTNIHGALKQAMDSMLKGLQGQNNYLIFLTDGLPTAGITDISTILRDSLLSAKASAAKMFIFGVGYDVNTGLLDLLAQESGGLAFYVEESESIETQVSQLFANVSSPLMTDIQIEIAGEDVQVMDLLPSNNLTIYKNYPLKIFGHYIGSGPIQVKVTGKIGEELFEQIYETNIDDVSNPYISKLWASKRISALLNKIKISGETQEAKEEVIRLSKKYGIPTPYTSYLVTEGMIQLSESVDVDTSQKVKDMTASVSPQSAPSPSVTLSLGATGRSAFAASKIQNQMSQSQNLADLEESFGDSDETVYKNVAGKVFLYLSADDLWVDTEYQDENVVEFVTYSAEYFEIIAQHPELKDYLSLGSNIKVNSKGVNYLFKEALPLP